jgi:hypothetical protein
MKLEERRRLGCAPSRNRMQRRIVLVAAGGLKTRRRQTRIVSFGPLEAGAQRRARPPPRSSVSRRVLGRLACRE